MTKKYTKDDIVFTPGCFDTISSDFETQEELDSFIEEIKQAVLDEANSSVEDWEELDYDPEIEFEPEFDLDEDYEFTLDEREIH